MSSSDLLFTKKNVDPHSVFEFGAVLGSGAFGQVYKATKKASGETVAIKKLEVSGEQVQEVLNEIDIMQQIASPFVVRFHGNYVHGKAIYIAMECASSDVQLLLKARGAGGGLDEPTIGPICKSVLGGLEYMHGLGFVHRDIKPGNILVTADGRVKLSDFGISSRRSRMHTLIGTPNFLAPEIVSGDEVGYTSKVDVWAFGITAIHIAQGQPPYSDVHPMRALFLIQSAPPPTLAEPAKWSAPFRAVIQHTLVHDPAKRYSAAQASELPFVKQASVTLPPTALVVASAAAAAPPDDADDAADDEIAPLPDQQKREMANWLAKQAALEAQPIDADSLLVDAEETARKDRKKRRAAKREAKKASGSSSGGGGSGSGSSSSGTKHKRGSRKHAPATYDPLSPQERALFDELALLRRSPKAYADLVADERIGKYSAVDNSVTVGSSSWDTVEGEKAAREAIAALRALGDAPLPKLALADGLVQAAHHAVKANQTRPNALEVLDQFGSSNGAARQSAVLGMDTARDIVIYLLIDDGQPERRKRQMLLDTKITQVGLAITPHETYETLALLVLCESWTDKTQ